MKIRTGYEIGGFRGGKIPPEILKKIYEENILTVKDTVIEKETEKLTDKTNKEENDRYKNNRET